MVMNQSKPPPALTGPYTEQHRRQSLENHENAHFDATESVLHGRVIIVSFIVMTSSSKAVVNPSTSTLMQAERTKLRPARTTTHLRLAAAHVTGVQAGVADCVLVAKPGKEALQTETVATVGRRAVSVRSLLVYGMT